MAVAFVGIGASTAQTAGSVGASTVSITPTMPAGAASGHRVSKWP